jgi:putative flippase GtrA
MSAPGRSPVSLITQAMRFAVVGGAATLAHFAVMAALIMLQWASPLVATFLGSLVGAAVAYWANRRHTFESDVPHTRALPRHTVVVAGSIVLNALLFRLAHGSFEAPVWFAQGLATGLCMVFNFVASRQWVFKQRSL